MAKKGKYLHISAVKRLATVLREYRVINNLSREELARLTGMSPRYIADLENCDKRCTIEYFSKIMNAIEINANFILLDKKENE